MLDFYCGQSCFWYCSKVRLFQNIGLSNLFVSIVTICHYYTYCIFLFCSVQDLFKANVEIPYIWRYYHKLLLLFWDYCYLPFQEFCYTYHHNIHIRTGITPKFFLSNLTTIYLLVSYGMLLNLGTIHNLLLDCGLHSAPFYLVTAASILTISALWFICSDCNNNKGKLWC